MSSSTDAKATMLAVCQEHLTSPKLAEAAAEVAFQLLTMGMLEATLAGLTGEVATLGSQSAPRAAKLLSELVQKAQLSSVTASLEEPSP